MNGLIGNVAQFWSQLLVEGATFMRTQQDKIAKGTFKTDDFVQASAKLWLDNATNWFRVVGSSTGMGGSTVILQLPGGAAGPISDQLLVPSTIGLGTVTTSGMKAITGAGTGDLAATLTGFDLLSVTVKNVAGTATGDMLAGLVYVVLSGGKTVPLAKVFVVIT